MGWRHVQADLRGGDEGLRSDSIRVAVLGESAVRERPAELHDGRRRQRSDYQNGLIWDVLRQVGAWIKGRDSSNPLTYGQGNQTSVQRLYAWGYSQSGNFLVTYLNAIHPLDVRALGKPLFDAYFIAVPGGLTAIHQCAQAPAPGDPRRPIANAGYR